MKFQHLPVGARFEYEGKTYVKTGPIAAASETGAQRMIPRHAVLNPLDGAGERAPARAARKLAEATVLAAFERYHAECLGLAGAEAGPALAAARGRFLAALAD
ncbi:hypothetical protein EZJ19_01540 [Parasulfuritortus cantonensis]|uniref:Uncharacterized protein n=1 Tax=Parasulfuritortus cantonensis TaxID=2528202 RepID=A0A4R1BNP3_9PROT|nr:hypothetical protein [Parasulfuritortus cantonensis]TCJ18916.1 hypothetical protein EZJ19_01540 [Parasulfuritortus cantonensis]